MTQTTPAPPPIAGIDAELLGPFVDATRNVFETMLGVTAQVDAASVITKAQAQGMSYDVSAIVAFGGGLVGAATLCMRSADAAGVVEAFAGEPLDEDDEGFADAVGELANMIAGGAKRGLNAALPPGRGAATRITTPSVVLGAGHVIAARRELPAAVLPCRSPAGNFTVEVALKKAKEGFKP